MRPSQREAAQLRPVQIQRHFTPHAEGSVLVSFGQTKVLCTASVSEGVPRFLKGKNQGWITAEYGMLPRSTHTRTEREAAKGRQGGRTLEIQRLIGRSLRACIDLKQLGDYSITIDCDVIQADGGTRTASITGACVALYDALQWMHKNDKLRKMPAFTWIAAVSVGVFRQTAVLDLDYAEDVVAQTDMNLVMNDKNAFIEIQGTAEDGCFTNEQLQEMLSLGQAGIQTLIQLQQASFS